MALLRWICALARRILTWSAATGTPAVEADHAEQLHQSEERFRIAFDSANIGMALVSPAGRWLRVNQSLCDILGYTAHELLQLDFQSVTHPEDLGIDLEYVKDTLAGRLQHYDMEKRYIHKEGRTVWALLTVSLVRDGCGRPLNFISQVQDISRRKAAELAVRRSEERYRALAENFPNGSIYMFDGDLRGILADGTGFRSMGFTKQMLEGKTIWEAFPSALCAAIEPPCRAALAGETGRREIEFAANVFEVDFLPIRDNDGKVICGMAMTQNITKRKQAEQLLANQLAELQRWQRVTIGREERIQQLKREINCLRQRLGEPFEYESQVELERSPVVL